MTDAVIVSTARTPLCKSWRGALNMTHGATMGGHVVKAALERAKLAPAEVEDVIMGCATPEGATGGNIARQIAIRAGMPVTVSGMTVNRFCSSGLQTVALAAQRIIAGEADIFVAGGVEKAARHGRFRIRRQRIVRPSRQRTVRAHRRAEDDAPTIRGGLWAGPVSADAQTPGLVLQRVSQIGRAHV